MFSSLLHLGLGETRPPILGAINCVGSSYAETVYAPCRATGRHLCLVFFALASSLCSTAQPFPLPLFSSQHYQKVPSDCPCLALSQSCSRSFPGQCFVRRLFSPLLLSMASPVALVSFHFHALNYPVPQLCLSESFQ